MPWVIFLCTSLLAAIINAAWLAGTQDPAPIMYWFNGTMLLGYGLMLLFYGHSRQQVLAVWVPVKQRLKRLALIAAFPLLFLGILWVAIRLATTAQCGDFNVSGRGHWIGWLLASLCDVTGPLQPALLMVLLGGWAIWGICLLVMHRSHH